MRVREGSLPSIYVNVNVNINVKLESIRANATEGLRSDRLLSPIDTVVPCLSRRMSPDTAELFVIIAAPVTEEHRHLCPDHYCRCLRMVNFIQAKA